ncbi:MAG TPA: hypothetical protein VKA34_16470 [Balneolales bacterium]|nr:hypothetical protein [Balneolales bacterium]
MIRQVVFSIIIVGILGFIQIKPANAQQNEITRQLSSLQGIRSFYLVVNVEGSPRVTSNKNLDVPKLTQTFKDTLTNAGLHILDNTKEVRAQNSPYLFVHINTMDAGRGLIPFNVSVNFYQPVRLTLNRSRSTLASTWATSAVGIVTLDKIKFIDGSAANLLEEFINDFRSVNGHL